IAPSCRTPAGAMAAERNDDQLCEARRNHCPRGHHALCSADGARAAAARPRHGGAGLVPDVEGRSAARGRELPCRPGAASEAARAQQAAAVARTAQAELDSGAAAADAFLTVLAADAGVRAAQANVDRLQVFANAVRTLVGNQLRPGVDQSRAEAELALASNQ